jgi:chemotaxis protein MotB
VARKKKAAEEDEGPSQAWLASYADAMTLLLAFFIMMFAFALVDEGKFFDFKVGVVAALGVPDPLTDNTASILSDGTGNFPEIGFVPVTPTEEQEEAIEELEEKLAEAGEVTVENADELRQLLEQRFELAGASEFVQVGIDERGVYVRFDGRVLFDSGSADLDGDSFVLLGTAARVLGSISNPLEIEGHTDNQPTVGTEWISNWELSVARSARVVRWMIEPGGLPAFRLTPLGRADTKPVASNNTEDGRRQNRRVEIVTRIIQTAPVGAAGASGDTATGGPDGGTTGAAEDVDRPDRPDPTDDPDPPDGTGGADGTEGTGEAGPGGDGVATTPVVEDPVDLEDVITIDPIENPVGIFPPLDPELAEG